LDWLKKNAYLAAWLSPLLALVGIIIRNPRTATGTPDWSRMIIYIVLLTLLAAALTPQLDAGTKTFAKEILAVGRGFLIVDRKQR